MANWFTETFSSEASEDDLVKARSLNITRIANVIVPVLVGISTAIGEIADTPPFNEPNFQRQVILALILMIGVVTTADILGRAIASHAAPKPSVGTILPTSVPAVLQDGKAGIGGNVVAFRASNDGSIGAWGEYLFVPDHAGESGEELGPSWQMAQKLHDPKGRRR